MAEGGEPAPEGPPSSGSKIEHILDSVPNAPGNEDTETTPLVQHIAVEQQIGTRNVQLVGSGGVSEKTAANQYKRYMMTSRLKLRRENYDGAIADFKEALKYGIIAHRSDHPEVLGAHLRLGALCVQCGRRQDALDVLLKVLPNIDSASDLLWQCHDHLAQTYSQFHNIQKEIEHYEKAIALLSAPTIPTDERLAHMRNNISNAYVKIGKLDEAMRHLEKAKEVMESLQLHESKHMVKIHLSLGDVYKLLGKKQPAIDELEKSIEVSNITHPGPTNEDHRKSARLLLVKLYEATGDTAKANEHKEKPQAVTVRPIDDETGASGEPQMLNETLGHGASSLVNSRPQRPPSYDVPHSNISYGPSLSLPLTSLNSHISDSSGGLASLDIVESDTGFRSLHSHLEIAEEGAPPLERNPPLKNDRQTILPFSRIGLGHDEDVATESTSQEQSIELNGASGMEVAQRDITTAQSNEQGQQLPIQNLHESALTRIGGNITADVTADNFAPIEGEESDAASGQPPPISAQSGPVAANMHAPEQPVSEILPNEAAPGAPAPNAQEQERTIATYDMILEDLARQQNNLSLLEGIRALIDAENRENEPDD